MRKERTTEIHSIVAVSGSSNEVETSREYAPFYSFTHGMEMRKQKAFWHARRVPASREDLTGTDVLLSFRDLQFKPTFPPEEIVFAHTLCTNRELAVQLPAGRETADGRSDPREHRLASRSRRARSIRPSAARLCGASSRISRSITCR